MPSAKGPKKGWNYLKDHILDSANYRCRSNQAKRSQKTKRGIKCDTPNFFIIIFGARLEAVCEGNFTWPLLIIFKKGSPVLFGIRTTWKKPPRDLRWQTFRLGAVSCLARRFLSNSTGGSSTQPNLGARPLKTQLERRVRNTNE